MTRALNIATERYYHYCGAVYSRVTSNKKANRFHLNTCKQCYQFMPTADQDGRALYYQLAPFEDPIPAKKVGAIDAA